MKIAIITGISRGIGKAIAEKFLNEGFRVIGLSTSGNYPFQHKYLVVHKIDLANPIGIKRFVEIIEDQKEKIDIVINNAGISIDKSSTISIDILKKTLDVNLYGLIQLTEQLIPFVNKGGHIINLSSGLGSLKDATNSYSPSYRISKAAVNMYTRTLASRLKDKNITVSCVDPGWVKTDMGGSGAQREPADAADDIFELANAKVDSGYFWYQGTKKAW
jgi:NAD(P)-dependent dehydrogenase (short-subunit alcohol dehydrogenase family)